VAAGEELSDEMPGEYRSRLDDGNDRGAMVQVPLSDGTTRDGLRFNPNALNVQTVVIEARVGEDDTQARVALTVR
jgi:hypothetical protein